jgi:AraC-like DNA-binding protein
VRYREYPSPASLRRHVECFWSLSSEGSLAPPEAGCVLPDGGVEVVVSVADGVLDGRGAGVDRMLVGPLGAPVRVRYAGRVELVCARLRPAAARPFCVRPMRELRDAVHPLAVAAPRLDAVLCGAGRKGLAREERLARLSEAVAGLLPELPAIDDVAEEAARRIAARVGRLDLCEVAGSLGVSMRTLERRFADAVGLSPRRLARVLRFRRAWEAATDAQSRAWSLLALDCGYSDQPHLIRDFRQFAGTSPGRLGVRQKRRARR